MTRMNKPSKFKWVSLITPTSPTRIWNFKSKEMEMNAKKLLLTSSDSKHRRMILLCLWIFSTKKVLQHPYSNVLKTLKEHIKIHYFSISMKVTLLTQKIKEKMMMKKITMMKTMMMKKMRGQSRRKRKMMNLWRNLNANNNDLFVKYLIN